MAQQRQSGYYWCRYGDIWDVFHFSGNYWTLEPYAWGESRYEDDAGCCFDEINETRITNPSENAEGLKKIQEILSGVGSKTYFFLIINTLPTDDDFKNEKKIRIRCVNREGKTWDELTLEEKELAKLNTIPG